MKRLQIQKTALVSVAYDFDSRNKSRREGSRRELVNNLIRTYYKRFNLVLENGKLNYRYIIGLGARNKVEPVPLQLIHINQLTGDQDSFNDPSILMKMFDDNKNKNNNNDDNNDNNDNQK